MEKLSYFHDLRSLLTKYSFLKPNNWFKKRIRSTWWKKRIQLLISEATSFGTFCKDLDCKNLNFHSDMQTNANSKNCKQHTASFYSSSLLPCVFLSLLSLCAHISSVLIFSWHARFTRLLFPLRPFIHIIILRVIVIYTNTNISFLFANKLQICKTHILVYREKDEERDGAT